MKPDDKLIEDLKKGKAKAFEKLYSLYAAKMHFICLRYVNETFEVSDIIQDAFIKVYENIKQFNGEGSFDGWIRRIFVNTAINNYKKNKKHYNQVEISSISFDDTDNESENELTNHIINNNDEETDNYIDLIEEANLTEQDILDAIKEIPENYRLVFNMFVLDKMMHKEIAELLGIKEQSSKTRLNRAKAFLKDIILKKTKEKVNFKMQNERFR